MRILKNEPVIQKLSGSLSKNETSNVAMVLETPTVLTNWWLVHADRTTVVDGWKNVDRYIGPDSQVVFDYIEDVPMGGISDLQSNIQFDDETGYDENFQTTGIIYPNTVGAIPGSCFCIKDSETTAIYIVTGLNKITMRSNPFVEVSFQLLSRDPNKIEQLMKQTHEEYTCCLQSLGTDKSLVLRKNMLDTLMEHVENYLDLVYLYKDLFYRSDKAAFVFDGLPDKDDHRACFIDMTLWRLMFDEGIVIYDDIITFANSNRMKTIPDIFTSCPDVLVGDHEYRSSILYKIYDRKTKGAFDEYRYPYIWNPPERITKYQGKDIWYLEGYNKFPGGEFTDFYIWDDEFLCRIRNNDPYPLPTEDDYEGRGCRVDACYGCTRPCHGSPVMCFNPYLRNVIIHWLNDEVDQIDFIDGIDVVDAHTIENYYLIPLLLGIYKQYIKGLQDRNAGTNL